MNRLGGRKMVAGLVVVLVGVVVTVAKGDVPEGLQQMLEMVFGALVLGNVGEHAAKAFKKPVVESTKAIEQPRVDLDPVLAELREIKGAVGTTQQGMAVILQMAQTRQ